MTAKSPSYAKESLPNEYLHSFHAGNVGDVWKHVVLLSVLQRLTELSKPLRILDCFAGAGGYHLQGTGEWTEGIGALLRNVPSGDVSIDRYLDIVRPRFEKERYYPGSPLLIQPYLQPGDQLQCFETHEETCSALSRVVAGSTQVFGTDGLAGLRSVCEIEPKEGSQLFALIDPPWVRKEDWQAVPKALIESWKACPQAVLLLWYPIKSYTRINTMIKMFQESRVPAVVMDLLTTPLEHQRNRLNGSGLLLVNADEEVIAEVSQAATWIGRACATQGKYWSARLTELGS
ncbi:MAG: 23S rRNA (adenine(2030)-N(6))-methyltransferase RlmJ [Deltaproteobacteria bacterium]|nr:23S rRNA (adenine(2030)-N(6))-methyltransferase RlmJ [Deltaproteobacteria bacterium]